MTVPCHHAFNLRLDFTVQDSAARAGKRPGTGSPPTEMGPFRRCFCSFGSFSADTMRSSHRPDPTTHRVCIFTLRHRLEGNTSGERGLMSCLQNFCDKRNRISHISLRTRQSETQLRQKPKPLSSCHRKFTTKYTAV